MKKLHFDIIVILFIAVALTAMNQFDMLDKSAGFLFIPFLAMYYIGQFAMRKFQK